MKSGRVKGGSIIPATIDTGRRFRSNLAQPIRNMAGSPRGTIGGAAQNIIEITSDDLVQNGGQYKLMGGTPLPMKIVTGRRSQRGPATVVYPVDVLGNYDPTFAGYIYKVLTADEDSGYDPSSLIGFWTQNELSGGVSIDYSGLGHHGAYTAVNLGQAGVPGMGMSSAGYVTGASFNNIYSASLNTAFNGELGTVLIFAKVSGVGIWTDGLKHTTFMLRADANNYHSIVKEVTNGRLGYYGRVGGVSESILKNGVSTTDWMALGITWNRAGVGVTAYFNAVIEGAAQAIANPWAGNLDADRTAIGCERISTTASIWSGSIGAMLFYNTEKTATEIAYLSTP